MKEKTNILAMLFAALVMVSTATGQIITVDDNFPADFTNIQAAIDDSSHGDIIVVNPGIYIGDGNRDIDYNGKAITVRSTDPNDPNIVAATIINCNGTEAEPHRGFYFHNSEGPDSVLVGLTIINGFGPGEDVSQMVSVGGAIFCEYSNPTIALCKVEGNYAYKGAGMCNSHSNPTVSNCTFSTNSAYMSPPYGGGAGGGMYNYYSDPEVNNSTFNDNWAQNGGGMFNFASSPTVTGCTFIGNSAGNSGAGMYNREGGSPTVRNCKFIGNSAGRTGGGMKNFEGSNSVVVNCLFSGNSAGEEGGGMYNCSHHNGPAINPTVVNCTFRGNSAGFDGGGIYDYRQVNPILVNCILWGNNDSSGMDESAQIHKSDYGTPVVNYCCVQGWTGILGGMGNIGDDPAFVYPATGNYHLLPGSPCINAGDPDYIYVPEEIDIDGDPRVMDGRIDMGVDEFILTPEPIIGISPTEFEIYADVGGANPENQILTIHNMGGGGTLYWMVAEDCPWLDINPESGESTGEIDEVTLSVNISGMNSGLYICELTINADGIVNSPQTVRIILHILDNDGLLHVPSEYGTIQEAIDTAVDGQAVILAPESYTGYGNRDLDFGGKAIAVRSTNPNDPVVVAATIIDCQGTEANPHRGFRFHSGEGPDSVIAGLTIANGYGPNEAVGYMDSAGGAIFCFVSNPTITLCRIKDNYADYKGGGIYCQESNPAITNCTFSGNSASYGGGIFCMESSPTITNCTFKGNMTNPWHGSGAGIYSAVDSHPMITNCTFTSNMSHSQAGGIYTGDRCAPTISNCIFSGNSAAYGGAMYNGWYSTTKVSNCLFSGNWARDNGGAMLNSRDAEPTITNCTFTGNSAVGSGGSIDNYQSSSTLTNCVLWSNLPNEIDGFATVSYSNINGGWQGQGNIDANPLFAEPSADNYHLLFESPCIDAGDPNFVPVPGEIDIDGEPRVMGGRVDMGADEFTSTLTPILRVWPTEFQFSSYENGPNPKEQIMSIRNIGSGTLNWEITGDCPWLDVYPASGESTGQMKEVTLSADISVMDPDSYYCFLTIAAEGALNSPQMVAVTLNLGGSELYVPSEYETIQAAIDAAIRWDTVIVAKGTYTGPGNRDIDFGGKAITVRSIDPNDPNTVAATIIDCNGTEEETHRGFYFHSGEDTDSVLSGFTIRNAHAHYGGGIYCKNSSPIITNCIFSDNWADSGGGIYTGRSNPILLNCIFNSNCAENMGGGMYNYTSSPTLSNCKFSDNCAAWGVGGGMVNASSSPILTNCTFTNNSAVKGGGMYNYMDTGPFGGFEPSNPTLTNCVFSINFASVNGGGIYIVGRGNAILTNCIFNRNSAGGGGGGIWTQYTKQTLTNCMFSGNSAVLGGGILTYESDLALTNCTFSGNSANQGGAICNWFYDSDLILSNCILWYDTPEEIYDNDSTAVVTHSNVQGGWPGEGNIDADPCFVDLGYWNANGEWLDGDYHLLPSSPCIDAGDPNYVVEPNETDLDGKPRVIGGRIDMGAYESPIFAEVHIVPRTINLASKGRLIIAFLWLPEDYDVADIDANSVYLEGEIEPEWFWLAEDQEVAIAKFSREEVQAILDVGEVELTITGQFREGTLFEGSDVIRVIDKGGGKN